MISRLAVSASSTAFELLENRFDGVQVVPRFVIEPCLDELRTRHCEALR
jgi:hypothetical protein